MSANDIQVGGTHYQGKELQHWDLVDMYDWDYFQAQIIKYVMRHKGKNGLQDLQKAGHFLEKYIELRYPHGGIVPQGEDPELGDMDIEPDCGPGSSYVDQD